MRSSSVIKDGRAASKAVMAPDGRTSAAITPGGVLRVEVETQPVLIQEAKLGTFDDMTRPTGSARFTSSFTVTTALRRQPGRQRADEGPGTLRPA